MKALLIIAVILGGATGSIQAQKKSTILGNIVIGKLTARDEATREITLKYPGKEGPEIFSGILVDNYKLRMDDGSESDMSLNQFAPGMHLRVFYKSDKKFNKIHRIDFLGNDEYDRLRNQLNVDQSTAVGPAENNDLPAKSPLKVFLAIAVGDVHLHVVSEINKWNRKNGDTYGKVEFAPDLDQADILIVVARGADSMVTPLPALNPYGTGVAGEWHQATSYLVAKNPGGLKVLWTGVAGVYRSPNNEISPRTTESIIAELEKRMKARARNTKK
jgi:hypothetical protein